MQNTSMIQIMQLHLERRVNLRCPKRKNGSSSKIISFGKIFMAIVSFFHITHLDYF